MEVALATMLETAVCVPSTVKEFALRACRPILRSEEDSFEVETGQMMGSLLSFPFLCLQNFLAFRWAFRSYGLKGKCPTLINGDDILFQSSDRGFVDHWFKVVADVGLIVERSKTSVDESFCSINSTLIGWSDGYLDVRWSPRLGMLRRCEYPNSLGRSFHDFLRGCPDRLRYQSARVWFDWHVAELRSAGVSLPSLGFRGRLAMRFALKLDLTSFPDDELPVLYQHGVVMSPDFVTRVPRDAVDEELRFQSAVEVSAAKWNEGWAPAPKVENAIRYCIARTLVRSKSRPWDFFGDTHLSLFDGLFAGHRLPAFTIYSERFFRHICRKYRDNFEPYGRTLGCLQRDFRAPLPVNDTELLATTVVDNCLFEPGRGGLPQYSLKPMFGEFVEDGPGRFVVCRG